MDPSQGQQVQQGTQPTDLVSGLIAPHLEGLAPEVRQVVEQKLRAAHSEWDGAANRKIEDLSSKVRAYEQYGTPEQVEFSRSFFESFYAEPVETIKWANENLKPSDDYNLMEALREELGANVPPTPEPTAPSGAAGTGAANGNGGTPTTLTAEDVQRIVNEALTSTQQQQQQEQQRQQLIQQAYGWADEAAKKYNLPVDDSPASPFTRARLLEAASAVRTAAKEAGSDISGQAAVEQVVEAWSQTVQPTASKPAPKPAPLASPPVAEGGSPFPGESDEPPDFHSETEFRSAMAKKWEAMNSSE